MGRLILLTLGVAVGVTAAVFASAYATHPAADATPPSDTGTGAA